ncbi:hypothetical protein F441_18444 [Phytophthora nicotianae CJ01A1]|uniref:Uncharacterized protein n=2 Tax=Phytophthora nicotianae TaxID=4792 RepID=W2I5U0_PHYNI|nr:hypothetical protein L915_18063 [Phytophthora nicotianae]ETL28743.1 hypothetical protein L916_17969 [Phytophthora nicotianae]ETP04857.1 hypothetical protein F441_18444 [Phytophthora nicotianae CJ01A1]
MVCNCIDMEKLEKLKELYNDKSLAWLQDVPLTPYEIRKASKNTSTRSSESMQAAHIVGLAVAVQQVSKMFPNQKPSWKDLEKFINQKNNITMATSKENLGLHDLVDTIIIRAIKGEIVEICGSKDHFKTHPNWTIDQQHERFLQIRNWVETRKKELVQQEKSEYTSGCISFCTALLQSLKQVG